MESKQIALIIFIMSLYIFISYWDEIFIKLQRGLRLSKRAKNYTTTPKQKLVPHPALRIPPNAPCFCDSGKKFKKCCKNKIPPMVTREIATELRSLLESEGMIVSRKDIR